MQKAYDAKLKYPENYLRIDTYVADYDNDNINDDQQAQSISSLADRVYILKYTNSPNQVFSAGVIQRLKNFGKNTAKKIELWSFLSSEPLYCGEILDNNSNYNTLDKLEKKWDDDYTTSYNAGDYTGGNNFRIGGHMWYSYQDAVSYTANQPTSYVSLGRHIKKSGNDCPVILTAQAVGTAPFNFKWNKEGSTTILRNVSNPISGVDTYRPTGVGKFFVTVTDATGKKSIDYIIIYSDFAVLYPCNPLGEGSLTSKGESGVETPGDFEAEHSELDGIAVITIGDQVYLKNTTDVFVDFSVFDNLGRKLPGVSGRIEGKGEFPVNLASGVYNVRCQKSNGEYFFKRFAH